VLPFGGGAPPKEQLMQINAYLLYQGQCKTAFKFYEQVLSGKITMISTHGESPMADKVAPEWRDAIIHARLEIAGQVIMGSDVPPEHFKPHQGFSMSIGVPTPAEAERIFKALSEGGTVQMPLQKTFWSAAFAMFTDKFGIPWMINCDQPS
jgi:PhnB protein